VPMVVYAGDTLVGFTMYGRDDDDGNLWVYRLMIAEGHQRKGYGQAAMLEVIDRLRSEPDCRFIKISWDEGNIAAETLYESLGFRKTGEIIEGEIVARLDL
jgi:diamine N-acetyltransferase